MSLFPPLATCPCPTLSRPNDPLCSVYPSALRCAPLSSRTLKRLAGGEAEQLSMLIYRHSLAAAITGSQRHPRPPTAFSASPSRCRPPISPIASLRSPLSCDLCRLCRLGLFVMRLSANRLVCHLFAFRSLLQLLLLLLRFVTFFFSLSSIYLFFICCCFVFRTLFAFVLCTVFALSRFCRCAIIVSVLLYIFNVRLYFWVAPRRILLFSNEFFSKKSSHRIVPFS